MAHNPRASENRSEVPESSGLGAFEPTEPSSSKGAPRNVVHEAPAHPIPHSISVATALKEIPAGSLASPSRLVPGILRVHPDYGRNRAEPTPAASRPSRVVADPLTRCI